MAKKKTNKTVNKKAKTQKTKELDEFRKLNTKEAKGHPHYVFLKKKKTYESIGITHGKRTKGAKNTPLSKNPNPNDPRTAYVVNEITESKTGNYGARLKGLGLSKEDKDKVSKLIAKLREKKTKK